MKKASVGRMLEQQEAQLALEKATDPKLKEIKAMSGAKFEKAYKMDQKKGHAETVALLKKYQKSGKNENLNECGAILLTMGP